jgi:UDP-glucose 4-epimerase
VYGGVKNRGLTGLIFESLFRQPKEITLSPDGSQVRDFIFIDDVVKALRSLLMSSRSGLMTVNVSTGKGTSLLELVRKIEKVSGKKVHYHFGPDVNETLSVIGNNSSLLSHIGWRPSVSMEQGLRDTLKQYMIKK